jgi:hypothetical protein
MMYRSFALIAGLLLLPAVTYGGSWGDTLTKSATGAADQVKQDAATEAKDTAKGAAKDAVGDTGDSKLKAAAQEGVDTGQKAAAGGADLETAGKKGVSAAATKALAADEAADAE